MPIPLMSLLEQYQIIKEIEKRISKIENISKILESNIKYGIRLKSNILRNAFEGKLVPQDPSDESVEILLSRVKRKSELNNSISKEKSKITKKQDLNDNQ
jgi:type I restriction enzyme S subunit